ncbi:anthranilate phosphoribosyltransferase, partial [Dietzia sp.]|uniref:anthranilate phosphoribosyltransferase n=1 Tax=Dietzia sp. TaxID=1871616 RepID=UPI002FDAC51F
EPEELAGLSDVMVDFAVRVPSETGSDCVDIVGTGGDRQGTVNISTMSSLVVAGAGIPVAKHGNRAASSKSGGADVLEALGVAIDLSPRDVGRALDELGITFCFAPVFHPALRYVGQARSEIGVPTVFNILGPLTNPLQPRRNLIGCAFEGLTRTMADVFRLRGTDTLVVRGSDGLDEVTTTGPTSVVRVHGGELAVTEIHPSDFGMPVSGIEELRGGDSHVNAGVARRLLDGERGAVRDAVLLNSAAAIVAFRNPGLDVDFGDAMAEGIAAAEQSIDSGAARSVLTKWVSFGEAVNA